MSYENDQLNKYDIAEADAILAAARPSLREQIDANKPPENFGQPEPQTQQGGAMGDIGLGVVKGAEAGAKSTMQAIADTVGAPVDFVNAALGKVGLGSEKPFMGTEFLTDMKNRYVEGVNSLVPEPAQKAYQGFLAQKYDNELLGTISELGSQFAIGAVPAAQAIRGFTSASPYVRGLMWGALADYAAFEAETPTITEELVKALDGATPEERTAFGNVLMNIVEKHSDDPAFVNRARNTVDGMGAGFALEGAVRLAITAAKLIPWKTAGAGLAAGAVAGSEEAEAGSRGKVVKELLDLVLKPEDRPTFNMAPPDQRTHKTPPQLLVEGSGEKAKMPVTQAYNPNNKQANFQNIDNLLQQHPDALKSPENWLAMEQSALGGQYLPHPPMQAIRYASNANLMAEKLRRLTPELKAGVDEGFEYVKQIRNIYKSGTADPKMTADMFVWGILSRGAGPAQQEAAFLDIMQDAQPMMQKVVDGTFTQADADAWKANMADVIPEGSPGKQVTMNVNAAGKLLFELAKIPPGSNQTVLETLHEMLSDETVSAKLIRRKFMELTDRAGIDNKVVSFTLLVAGRDDVLVMDRIQGRHLWDDGRFEGANIYDGFYKEGTTVQEGLLGIFKGPRGVLVTEMLEEGMRPNVEEAYRIIGRPEDASLGRFHWETWVIEGEQVVSHSTLDSIAKNNPIGGSVTEGKTDEFASGFRYIRGSDGPVQEYPLSDGSKAYMTPTRAKEFLAFIKKPKAGIVPKDFKVTERADIPWYEREEVNREALDKAARDYANATADGTVLSSAKGSN